MNGNKRPLGAREGLQINDILVKKFSGYKKVKKWDETRTGCFPSNSNGQGQGKGVGARFSNLPNANPPQRQWKRQFNTERPTTAWSGQGIDEVRRNLPVAGVEAKIVEAVKSRDTIIFIGETASGKTTQIPQYLMKAGVNGAGVIGVTQPRKVAAISIAGRVSQEARTTLGDLVGYSVRFDDKTSPKTKIKYMTDGMLLREALTDPQLKKYTVIVLDEAHERCIQTDVLFGVVKRAQSLRKGTEATLLRVVVMSATMDVDHFSAYFNKAPVYYLQGRQYPIQIMYALKEQPDYVHSALVTLFQIHQNEPEGDILVFCTGQEEIESMVSAVREASSQLPTDCIRLVVYPLYAALPSQQQMKVFEPSSPGEYRKVICSTNIAETSLTIPGIKYVIDTGNAKARTYKSTTELESLKVERISKAQASQRAGRAGRESSGFCYRLYTQEEFNKFKEHAIPEIQRCNLVSVVLHLVALGIHNVTTFDFMDRPSDENIANAVEQLLALKAIEGEDDNFKLTKIGEQMVVFPLEPRFSRILIASIEMGCTDEVLTIISLLYVENVFHVQQNKRQIAAEVLKKFQSSEGDLIRLLKVFHAYRAVKGNKEWCHENFVHVRNMKNAAEVRKQLAGLCLKANLKRSSCGENTEILRKCLLKGLFSNVALLQKEGHYKTTKSKQEVYIHPSSCLFGSKPEAIVYTELVETTKRYLRNISLISVDWL